jgi:hypothetical protein
MQSTTEWLDGHLKIPELLRTAPQARPVLDRYGRKGCGDPLGLAESLAFFAQAHEVALLETPEVSPPPVADGVIAANDRVSVILDRYPALLDTFVTFGFRPLANPLLRRLMARHVTLAAACRHMDVNLETFLAVLNDARVRCAASSAAAPHCCDSCAREG